MLRAINPTVRYVFLFMSIALSVTTRAQSPKQPSPEVRKHIERITACITGQVVIMGDASSCKTLKERMAELHIPGASIAVVHNGAIEWAEGFGVVQVGGAPVTPETLFQAASISKPLSAMAALHLVQQGKLSLDADIDQWLTTWKVPASTTSPKAVVTLRELITHTAGFSVHGFPGYAAGAPVPTLVQILDGEKPANTPPIRLESPPKDHWQYSGGGFTVMQQMLLDISKVSYPKLMHGTVLAAIGMKYSTYQQPLPVNLRADAATPYNSDGTPVEGGPHTYPEMAAAGLWTTPSDIALYILENQRSLAGKANHVLSPEMTKQMMTPGMGNWGLGVQIGGAAANPYFTHGGVNDGFESLFVGYENSGDGAVVMTNASGGSRLAEELMGAIAAEYKWPDFAPVVRTTVKVNPSMLAKYVGKYEFEDHFVRTVTLQNGQLVVSGPNQHPGDKLYPESETTFFATVANAEFEFKADGTGQVASMILHYDGKKYAGTKK
jgi:CubicO group peptidase (beta-lactamase class C family)